MSLSNIKAFEGAIQSNHKDVVVEIESTRSKMDSLFTTEKIKVLALSLLFVAVFLSASTVAFHANQGVAGYVLLGCSPLALAINPIYMKCKSSEFEREVDQFLSNQENFDFVKDKLGPGSGYSNSRFDIYVNYYKKTGRRISFVEKKTSSPIITLPLSKVIN